MDALKLWAVRLTPWFVLRALWLSGLVKRTTIFRWETNIALWKWA